MEGAKGRDDEAGIRRAGVPVKDACDMTEEDLVSGVSRECSDKVEPREYVRW